MGTSRKPGVYAIVLAGGSGVRMGKLQKQFLRINKKPILFYSLDVLVASPDIRSVVVVVPKDKVGYTRTLLKDRYPNRVDVIVGGKTRRHSSYCGLEHVRRNKLPCEFIIFHDGVRPLISQSMIRAVINGARKDGAAVLGSKALNVIAHVRRGVVADAYNANTVYNTQTPHCYKFEWILAAHESPVNAGHARNAHENIELVHAIGKKIRVIDTFYRNMKLTFPQDMAPLSALVKEQEKSPNFFDIST